MDKISTDFSKFRRHFYGSPFERMLTATEEGTTCENLEFSTRENERTWIISFEETQGDKSVSVFYGLGFTDPVDKTIAKLILDVIYIYSL